MNMDNKKIYAIVKDVRSSSGHGEPGESHVALIHDGDIGSIGRIHPVFTTKEDAEHYKSVVDKYNFFRIVELTLMETF